MLLLTISFWSNSQTYNFRNFSVEDGLSQSQVLSLHQDHKGMFWIGTNGGGISIYDGKKFNNLSEKNGLINNRVFSIIQDKQLNYWIGTLKGVSVYNGVEFKNYTDSNGISGKVVYKIFEDSKGIIWLGTNTGVSTFQDGQFKPFNVDSLINKSLIFTIYEDHAGNIWFGTNDKGVFKYDGKKLTQLSTNEGLSSNTVKAIIENKKGELFVCTVRSLCKLVNNRFETISFDPSFPGYAETVTSAVIDKKGVMWFGTFIGVVRYDGINVKRYREANGLISNKIWCGLLDREGNLWFGSPENGLSKFSDEKFVNYSEKDSLANDNVSAVYEDSQGNIWIGSQRVGLSKFDGKKFHVYTPSKDKKSAGLPASNVYSIYEDKSGILWFGTRGAGVCRYKDGKFIAFDKEPLLNATDVYSIIEDKGAICLGTDKGIIKIVGDSVYQFEPLNVPKGTIWNIFKDKERNLWLSHENGVAKVTDRIFRYFTKKDGFIDGRVRTTRQDSKGYYWFATDNGVYRYDNQSFVNINDSLGLSSNAVYTMLFDIDGNLWIGTNKGLDKLDVNLYNSTGKINLKHYGKIEGFMGLECYNNAGYKDSKGRLWFGTIKGVTVYDPKYDKPNPTPPITTITNIRLSFENFDYSQYSDGLDTLTKLPINLVLPYNKNHLTFDFIGLSLTIPEKVRYQFKLEGLDEEWFPVTSATDAVYSNIPPGKYTFKVKACNNDGVWNEASTDFSFEVLPPWYRTWWFYTLAVLIILGSFYAYITVRTRNLEKSKRLLEEEVQLRTRELREEKEKVEQFNEEIVEQKGIIEAKNRDITDSINYAKRIQDALLPSSELIQSSYSDAFVLYKPKDIVSGDFYWFAMRDNKRLIAACDCTGHGVPGAFMSMIGHNLLNQIVLERNITTPSEVLRELNIGIKEAFARSQKNMSTNDGMDIAFCMYEPDKGVIEYAGAQRPMYFIRDGILEEIKGSKSAIGGITPLDFEFTNNIIEIKPGDRFYFSSDGYADQFGGENGKKFMTKRFKENLASICHLDMTTQRNKLNEAIEDWKAGVYEQVDDVLVIGIKVF